MEIAMSLRTTNSMNVKVVTGCPSIFITCPITRWLMINNQHTYI